MLCYFITPLKHFLIKTILFTLHYRCVYFIKSALLTMMEFFWAFTEAKVAIKQ